MKLSSAVASTCLPYTITITHRRLLSLSLPSPHSPFHPSNSLHTKMSQFLAPTAQGSSPTTTTAATADGSHPLPNPQPWLIVGLGNPDLPFAKLRFKPPKGGHGGRNGMKNIIDCFKGSRDFPHLRIGIGRPPGKIDAANFVFHPFTKQEHQQLDFTFQQGVEAVRILLLEGLAKSATFVNRARTMEQLA